MLNESMQIERGDFGLDNQRVASIEANLGTVYEREGDPLRAMKMTQDACASFRSAWAATITMVGYFMDAVAKLYLDAGQPGRRREHGASSAQDIREVTAAAPFVCSRDRDICWARCFCAAEI